MFVRKIWKGVELPRKGKEMSIKKIDCNSETFADFKQLIESIINIEVRFISYGYGRLFFAIHPHGKYCTGEEIELNYSIGADDVKETYKIETLFKTLGVLMEHKNGIITICPDEFTRPDVIKRVEKIVERVSTPADTVFWFCIKRISEEEDCAAKRYFDYLGVTEEEWLLGL